MPRLRGQIEVTSEIESERISSTLVDYDEVEELEKPGAVQPCGREIPRTAMRGRREQPGVQSRARTGVGRATCLIEAEGKGHYVGWSEVQPARDDREWYGEGGHDLIDGVSGHPPWHRTKTIGTACAQ